MCFAMLDIDNLKRINDTYGHLSGDQVIKGLSQLLKQSLRRSDYIGRYSRKEFAIVLPDCGKESARAIIDGLRSRFATLNYRHKNEKILATFSAGIAAFPDYDNPEQMIQSANDALYSAKESGRNRVIAAGYELFG